MIYMVVLDVEQIERLYECFDFEDEEEIVFAYFRDDGQLCIEYTDMDGVIGTYEPNLYDDQEKLDYILKK